MSDSAKEGYSFQGSGSRENLVQIGSGVVFGAGLQVEKFYPEISEEEVLRKAFLVPANEPLKETLVDTI